MNRAAQFRTLHELAKEARAKLSRDHWDYLVGAADTETSLRRNRAGLDSWVFKPRILNDVSEVRAATTLLGSTLRIPVVLPPLGSMQLFDEAGGVAAARAAADFGVLQILSSVCLPDFEAVATAVPGPRVLQLYLMQDQGWMDEIITRAVELGYTGFCLTADTQTYSRRERDILKGFVPPSGSRVEDADFGFQARMSWATVEHIKQRFDIPLLIKGVAVGEDARRCIDHGVDVVYVSNHGGRQLDHARACIDALPEVVDAVAGRVPVLVDGGFLRGADVVKALCLGATAVGMGRLEGLAMAAGGFAGLLKALEIVEHEVVTTMALLGADALDKLNPDLVEKAAPLGVPAVLSAFPLLAEDY
jgi:glycolate oxidase